jgi:hypothetical protein
VLAHPHIVELFTAEKVCRAGINDDQANAAEPLHFGDKLCMDFGNVVDADDKRNPVLAHVVAAQRVGTDHARAHVVSVLASEIDDMPFLDSLSADMASGATHPTARASSSPIAVLPPPVTPVSE